MNFYLSLDVKAMIMSTITRVCGTLHIHLAAREKVIGLMKLGPNNVIAKGDTSCTYFCYVRIATLIVQVGRMPWPHTGRSQYHAQFWLPDNGRAIKGLVVCYVVWLESMKEWVLGLVQGARILFWWGWLSNSSTAGTQRNLT